MSIHKCLACDTLFESPRRKRTFCTVKCTNSMPGFFAKFGLNNKGKESWRKGKTKYTEEEKHERMLESGRKSYRKNIEKRLFYYRQLAARRRGITGSFTKEEWLRVLEKQNHLCKCNKFMDKPTIDHIIPISKWSEWIIENPVNYECNDIQNIQALCKSCNSSKHNKIL